jgi:argininosuccinate lyase
MLDRAAVEYRGEPVGLSAESIRRALDPVAGVHHRTITGSPGPEEMRKQIAASRQLLERDRTTLAERRRKLVEAERRLEEGVRKVTG